MGLQRGRAKRGESEKSSLLYNSNQLNIKIMSKQELNQYLIEECEYSEEDVKNMDAYDKIDAWLKYNGIIGFTSDIIQLVRVANQK